MTIQRSERGKRMFLVIDNRACVEDQRLSWKARGLLIYLLSKPDHWEVRESQLVAAAPDGLGAVRSGLAELEAVGYLVRRWLRSEEGTFSGRKSVVYDTPQEEEIQPSGVQLSAIGSSPAVVRNEKAVRNEESKPSPERPKNRPTAAPPSPLPGLAPVGAVGEEMPVTDRRHPLYRWAEFWTRYPTKDGRRGSKADAEKVWRKMSQAHKRKAWEQLANLIRAAAEGTYPPHAVTYLRQGERNAWTDYWECWQSGSAAPAQQLTTGSRAHWVKEARA